MRKVQPCGWVRSKGSYTPSLMILTLSLKKTPGNVPVRLFLVLHPDFADVCAASFRCDIRHLLP